jgi:hypothetical protein
MTGRQKRELCIFFGFIGMIVIFIAAGLPHLDFKPGLPLPDLSHDEIVIPQSSQNNMSLSIRFLDFFKYVLEFILACNVTYLIYQLIKGVSWRKIGSSLLTGLKVLLAVSAVILFAFLILPKGKVETIKPIPTLELVPQVRTSLEPAPHILLWVVGIILFTAFIIVGFWIFRTVTHKSPTLDYVQNEAEKAYDAILSGRDIKDVILKCYIQMGRILETGRGIERKPNMTTGEFEQLLVAEGIAFQPIHVLTQLFELVRYGHEQLSHQDEQNAKKCLLEIVQYCEAIKKAN